MPSLPEGGSRGRRLLRLIQARTAVLASLATGMALVFSPCSLRGRMPRVATKTAATTSH
jgi:hypothetical protein